MKEIDKETNWKRDRVRKGLREIEREIKIGWD
jgi:hypothetical protein